MRKALLLLLLSALSASLTSCGSGGAGSADMPPGVNPGTPALVQLTPSSVVAQTNSSISLLTKVLDSNGMPVRNITVKFTNLSLLGVLSSATANTDSFGIARVSLYSATSGFVTVKAEVDSGLTLVRDDKTVYFSTYSLAYPSAPAPAPPYLVLEVDANNNGIFNETDDLTLFQNTADNQVLVRATVYDGSTGAPLPDITVTFGADRPYKAGSSTTCNDGSASCDVYFPSGNAPKTNSSGQASTLVQVSPAVLTSFTTVLNITASGSNSASGMISLFLGPVVIDTKASSVSAIPSTIAVSGAAASTSTVTAVVLLNTASPAPNGTTVTFKTTCGSVTPFGQTAGGTASATFTAPSTPGTCAVSAAVGGASVGTANVTATSALMVQPASQTISSGDTAQFTIIGGTAGYTITSSNPSFPASAGYVSSSGGAFTVAASPVGTATTVTYTISDSAGASATATLTINPSAATFYLLPNTATISVNGSITLTIVGGTSPYSIVVDSNAVELTWDGGTNITVTGANAGTSVITVLDSKGKTALGTVTVK